MTAEQQTAADCRDLPYYIAYRAPGGKRTESFDDPAAVNARLNELWGQGYHAHAAVSGRRIARLAGAEAGHA